ncbi:GNAT family N-acetyltransferase [Paenibacillus sp. BSR1-1]|uniref:GNAT family N-acetyltransferase n=1 Tax=Paenibacillus sp. BSR1-1 TaxID=3020845 RepID=UPI0025B07AF1|nr:GNAT family N-acetyltransferase [Paenibacillus sp. BSR1-1]MDN3017259.1 GNAT family N-acetyltransferase [Paenibacillus sp. BSR1-1]
MKIEALQSASVQDFVEYCRMHRKEVDDSFLYDEHLKKFEPDSENPTYIATNQQGEIRAAASLIMDEYNRRGKRARFRIFHSEIEDRKLYDQLLESLIKHTSGLDKVFIFIPLANKSLAEMMDKLNFNVERYAFLLVREDLDVSEVRLPEDYRIRNFVPGKDEEIWCKVRNAGFATLKGNETPVTLEMVAKMVSSSDYLDGGMKILFHKEKPVGVVRGAADEYEDAPIMNIGPLAILPEYQGKGLGRQLLRASLQFAKENSYKRIILSVNGENERAQALYVQEGFKQVEGVTCYQFELEK